MDDADRDLRVLDLRDLALGGLDGTLDVGLDDQAELLHRALLDGGEEILEADRLAAAGQHLGADALGAEFRSHLLLIEDENARNEPERTHRDVILAPCLNPTDRGEYIFKRLIHKDDKELQLQIVVKKSSTAIYWAVFFVIFFLLKDNFSDISANNLEDIDQYS